MYECCCGMAARLFGVGAVLRQGVPGLLQGLLCLTHPVGALKIWQTSDDSLIVKEIMVSIAVCSLQ